MVGEHCLVALQVSNDFLSLPKFAMSLGRAWRIKKNNMQNKNYKKVYALYLSVAFFFSIFSFANITLAATYELISTNGYEVETNDPFWFVSPVSSINIVDATAWEGHYPDTSGTNYGTLTTGEGIPLYTLWCGQICGATNGNYYWVDITSDTGDHYVFEVQRTSTYQWIQKEVSLSPPTPPDTSTRIIEVIPHHGDIFATSSNPITLGFHMYINEEDIGKNIKYKITGFIPLQYQDAGSLLGNDMPDFNMSATTSGDFYFSTTTTMKVGDFQSSVGMMSCTFYVFCFPKVATSTSWVMSTSTIFGQFANGVAVSLNELIGDFSNSSTTEEQGALVSMFQNILGKLKYKMPWGYFFLIVDRINLTINSTATSTPNFPMTIPGTALITTDHTDKTLNWDMEQIGTLYASTTSIQDGKSFSELFNPVIRIIIWAGFATAIILYFKRKFSKQENA